MAHACILPRVFDRISEDDVLTSDVKAAIEFVVKGNIWWAYVGSENILAILQPIFGAKKGRAHGENLVRDLEPAELGAHLPHPLSAVFLNVIGCVLKY